MLHEIVKMQIKAKLDILMNQYFIFFSFRIKNSSANLNINNLCWEIVVYDDIDNVDETHCQDKNTNQDAN